MKLVFIDLRLRLTAVVLRLIGFCFAVNDTLIRTYVLVRTFFIVKEEAASQQPGEPAHVVPDVPSEST